MGRGDRAADYDYDLPPGRIAQRPAAPRDASRLMVVDRAGGSISHRTFRDLPSLMSPGDALVVNRSRVMRSRLLGTRASGGAAEILLVKPLGGARFEAMVHPGGKLRPGRVVHIADGLDVAILEITPRRTRVVELRTTLDPAEAIERHGHVPLPPYIGRADDAADAATYQTIFARESGSVAAPTAGLHFTPELLDAIEARGVERIEVLLHVGMGTFKPVDVDDLAEHVMHEEWYTVSAEAARAHAGVRARGGRIWAVGTTTVRALESSATTGGTVAADTRETTLFIRPPYTFRAVDHLVTNFHLPRSTLLMLVSAFAGYELTMRAYREAIDRGYRFYSYGDAMVVV